jgi:DHA1 family bicyclomycin/chloramphenicol resistance-like MFS transporter
MARGGERVGEPGPRLSEAERRRFVPLLPALVAFQAISTDLYLPALPTLVHVFETEVATVQLTLSLFLLGFALAQLGYGPASDRFGRRPILLAGTALYFLASVACALASSIEQLILFRFLQGAGACAGPVLGRAVVRDVYGPEQAARVLAYLAAAMAIAPTLVQSHGSSCARALRASSGRDAPTDLRS